MQYNLNSNYLHSDDYITYHKILRKTPNRSIYCSDKTTNITKIVQFQMQEESSDLTFSIGMLGNWQVWHVHCGKLSQRPNHWKGWRCCP